MAGIQSNDFVKETQHVLFIPELVDERDGDGSLQVDIAKLVETVLCDVTSSHDCMNFRPIVAPESPEAILRAQREGLISRYNRERCQYQVRRRHADKPDSPPEIFATHPLNTATRTSNGTANGMLFSTPRRGPNAAVLRMSPLRAFRAGWREAGRAAPSLSSSSCSASNRAAWTKSSMSISEVTIQWSAGVNFFLEL
jgi:hypothetical protein